MLPETLVAGRRTQCCHDMFCSLQTYGWNIRSPPLTPASGAVQDTAVLPLFGGCSPHSPFIYCFLSFQHFNSPSPSVTADERNGQTSYQPSPPPPLSYCDIRKQRLRDSFPSRKVKSLQHRMKQRPSQLLLLMRQLLQRWGQVLPGHYRRLRLTSRPRCFLGQCSKIYSTTIKNRLERTLFFSPTRFFSLFFRCCTLISA